MNHKKLPRFRESSHRTVLATIIKRRQTAGDRVNPAWYYVAGKSLTQLSNTRLSKWLSILIASLLLSGCLSTPPEEPDDICEIFYEKRGWYDDARRAQVRWGTPIPVLMAFAHQESGFRSRAKPPRTKILWIFPGPRPASAFGFSQATDGTWEQYKKATGNWGADRNDFEDAMDFIGWYNAQSHRRNGLSQSDTYSLYLAYHEGHGGFARRAFENKQWLKDVASKVTRRANMYSDQLKTCEEDLQRSWLWRLFFFWT